MRNPAASVHKTLAELAAEAQVSKPTVIRFCRSGASVIAITSPDSPLAHAASLTLPVAAAQDTDLYTPMMSRLAHLAVIDVLVTGIALAGGKEVERLRRLKRHLQIKRLPKEEWDPGEGDPIP